MSNEIEQPDDLSAFYDSLAVEGDITDLLNPDMSPTDKMRLLNAGTHKRREFRASLGHFAYVKGLMTSIEKMNAGELSQKEVLALMRVVNPDKDPEEQLPVVANTFIFSNADITKVE